MNCLSHTVLTENPGGSKESQLEVLRHTQNEIQDLEVALRLWIKAARANGATWVEIGQALRTTKQAAQQKYGWMVKT